MDNFLTTLTGLFVIAITAVIIFRMFFKKRKSSDTGGKKPFTIPFITGDEDDNVTVKKRRKILTMNVCSTGKSYDIEAIPIGGLLVGREDEREELLPERLRANKLTIEPAHKHLSRKSFTIAKDEAGFFLNPHEECSNNVALTLNGDPVEKSIPIEDGTSIYIGDEKIVFNLPKNAEPTNEPEKKTVVRRIV